ncbi:nitrophenyl compound nitroreductase subunit ArsF family protein [Halosquirtibacter laminarini]|uniref:Nitrophenyl compound nitroreductase subunit ArsF family protein n=1 Tax=Halosquirtibacter laminarini TaxID=3374600 RepID=A0AC61NIY6_9BACT|nr:nitrophenyl compound nitroreductase subunit ArsF family protein [Prolixibacteraceae bacterium]
MKKIITLITSVILVACVTTNLFGKNSVKQNSKEVEVVYFHFTQRCTTCQAIEMVVKSYIEKRVEQDNAPYSFQSINIDKPESQEFVKAKKIEGQTLLLICSDRVIDLTDMAFDNADYHPDELTKILEKKLTEITL